MSRCIVSRPPAGTTRVNVRAGLQACLSAESVTRARLMAESTITCASRSLFKIWASVMSNYLISGDPLEPCGADMIAQTAQLPLGEKPEGYTGRNCGWRILTGNHMFNNWARVILRYELERFDNGKP